MTTNVHLEIQQLARKLAREGVLGIAVVWLTTRDGNKLHYDLAMALHPEIERRRFVKHAKRALDTALGSQAQSSKLPLTDH